MRLQPQQVSKPHPPQSSTAAHSPAGRPATAITGRTSAPDSPPATSPTSSPTSSTTAKSKTTPCRTAKKIPPGSKTGATSVRSSGATPPPSAAILTTAPRPVSLQRRSAMEPGRRIWRTQFVALILVLLLFSLFVTIIPKVRNCSKIQWKGEKRLTGWK